jgi:hypothetical protein
MIGTIFKDKLPGGLSYPVSLSDLQQLFARCLPEDARVGVVFLHKSAWHQFSETSQSDTKHGQAVLALQGEFPTLRIKNEKVPDEDRDLDWYLVVYPVPFDRRSPARQALVRESAAARMQEWASFDLPTARRYHRKRLVAFLLPNTDRIEVREDPPWPE